MARMPELQSTPAFLCHLGCRTIGRTFNAFHRLTLTRTSVNSVQPAWTLQRACIETCKQLVILVRDAVQCSFLHWHSVACV